jgi:nitrate reductase assembly molybdenum cofactor insertion protein NarJ
VTTQNTGIFDKFARLLDYPENDYRQRIEDCCRELETSKALSYQFMRDFSDYAWETPLSELQEAFTRTFELNPLCALEVGWQLYGENYDRGKFIVNMRQKIRELGINESTELPDHLFHILLILGRLERREMIEFSNSIVIPAIVKMIAGLKNKNAPFDKILLAIHKELQNLKNTPTGKIVCG